MQKNAIINTSKFSENYDRQKGEAYGAVTWY